MTTTPVPVPLIDPRIDVYGKDGRTGALADLLEFRTIKGNGMSAADLADLITEMGWTDKPKRQIIVEGDDENDAADPLADQTFSLLDERREILGARYPFELVFGRIQLKEGFDLNASPYFALLAITIAHAWRVPCGAVTPEAVMEAVVAEALGQRLAAVGLGTGDRMGTSFVDNLREGAAAIGLAASPDPTPRRVRAKDAGVDTLAGYIWPDGRPGHWLLIGQVTCGRTDIWGTKLTEPKPAIWKGYLQEPIAPQRFLAVPHHVDARFFNFLHSQEEGLVVDRLRLVLALDAISSAVSPVVDAVLLASAA
jgi:hypothetical protein